MTSSNVATISGPSNTPVEHSLEWILGHINAGRIKRETGRLIMTGARQLFSVLQENEARDVASVLINVDDIAGRWLRIHQDSDASTASTYAQRTRRLLEWHKSFLEDPMSFRFDVAERSTGDGEKRKPKPAPAAKAPPVAPIATTTTPAAPPPAETTPSGTPLHKLRIRVGEGRYVHVDFPEDIAMNEVARVVCALWPHAKDFDGSKDTHRRLMLPPEL